MTTLKSTYFFRRWCLRLFHVSFILILVSCNTHSNGQEEQNSDDGVDSNGFVDLFAGGTLDNWEGDPAYWRIENGVLIGETTASTPPLENNTFLTWKGGKLGDFELKAEFRITEKGNSGINYRSESVTDVPFALKGYQADIDGMNHYTGQNYEERKRTTLAYRGEQAVIEPSEDATVENNAWTARRIESSLGSSDSLKTLINSEDWNEIHIIAKGNRLQHYINGVLMSDVRDEDEKNFMASGLLGVQIHVGPPMKVEYRSFRVKQVD